MLHKILLTLALATLLVDGQVINGVDYGNQTAVDEYNGIQYAKMGFNKTEYLDSLPAGSWQRKFNVGPGPMSRMTAEQVWAHHGQNVSVAEMEARTVATYASRNIDATSASTVTVTLTHGAFAFIVSFILPDSNGRNSILEIYDGCKAVTSDGVTHEGQDCVDKVIAALTKAAFGSLSAVGTGFCATLISGNQDANAQTYELANIVPEAAAKRALNGKRQPCANNNYNFYGQFGVGVYMQPNLGAKMSSTYPCGSSAYKPGDDAQGAFGAMINNYAQLYGALNSQWYTISDGSQANVWGGSLQYETVATDTCPQHIGFTGCEI